MKYSIKYFGNPDGIDLKRFVPKEGDFFIEVEIEIQFGDNEENVENYSFAVGTPNEMAKYYNSLLEEIANTLSTPKMTFVGSTIVIEKYDYDKILEFITKYLDEIKGRTQTEQSLLLARNLDWEFLAEYPDSFRIVFDDIKSGK